VSGLRRVRVRVRGRVQGVFFRETTRRAAAKTGVAGYARNLADGSVEAEVTEEPPEGTTGFSID
jgi:acylphosphatase